MESSGDDVHSTIGRRRVDDPKSGRAVCHDPCPSHRVRPSRGFNVVIVVGLSDVWFRLPTILTGEVRPAIFDIDT
jgi:hypothetical protein